MEKSQIQLLPNMKEIFACPFFWGDLEDNEAEDILANEPFGSYVLRKSWSHDYLLRISFKDSNIIRHGHICKLDISDHETSDHFLKLEDILKDDSQTFCDIKETLKTPVLRKNPFSLQKLTRAIIADSTSLQEVTRLKLPKKLQDFVMEYQCSRSNGDRFPSFPCDDFLPDLNEEMSLFHSEMDANVWFINRIHSMNENIQHINSRWSDLATRVNELEMNLTKIGNALDEIIISL